MWMNINSYLNLIVSNKVDITTREKERKSDLSRVYNI